ncbi:nitrogen fixation protein NifM [Azonexus sp. IMCC34842]|uniref:nitrogen fixation protein NifM n=1 Tax=Azonexus sp. IMCC34842 TaxID=3420950 RepID=UPI003D0B47FD
MLHGYLELKLSWQLFQKAPETLSEPERNRLVEVAEKQDSIEQRILGSSPAANVVIPAATLTTRIAEIRKRYASDDEFAQDLERNGLNETTLAAAVERDVRVESVLEKVASATPAVSLIDAEIYYRLHPEAFDRPEARRLSHILITFDNPGERAKAAAQLATLRSTLKTAEQFGQAAHQYSQCPTAMEGGKLGIVKRQQLYAELEPAAFALTEGDISAVLESPIGLHILRCDEIFPSGMLPFAEVSQHIVERLTDKRRRQAQKDWIKALTAPRAQGSAMKPSR